MYAAALYVLKMKGCSACQAAMPAVRAFAKKHGAKVYVETYDIADYSREHHTAMGKVELPKQAWPEDLPWAPRATPTYVLVRSGRQSLAKEGALTLAELEQFVLNPPA